jgi:hypothetical protein
MVLMICPRCGLTPYIHREQRDTWKKDSQGKWRIETVVTVHCPGAT